MSAILHRKLKGGCACGAVRFEINGPVRPVIACHCETCRRTSGHYWAATQTYRDNLSMLETRGLKWYRSSTFARRGFCAECGSSLLYRPDDADRVSIAAGALDVPTGLSLVEHICTAEANDYYTIGDTLTHHAGYHVSERWLLPPRDE